VHLDFDTGSADLWVFSSELPPSKQSGHTIYNPKKSSTAKPLKNATWNISYGDGSSASGNVYTDTVTLGGLVIKNQAVECASKLSPEFATGQGDGLLGLAFDLINTVKPSAAPTPVQNMNTEGVTPKGAEIFTCMLTRFNEEPGFYTFGYIDEDGLNGATPFYTPVVDNSGFWKVNSTSAVVAGKTINRPHNTAICDTGTTLCLVDSALCSAIYGHIKGAKFDSNFNGWVFPSTTLLDHLPSVQIVIGSKPFDVSPADLAFGPSQDGWYFGGFQDRGSMTFDILGDVFLKNVYAIWDAGNKRFGAVPRAPTSNGAFDA